MRYFGGLVGHTSALYAISLTLGIFVLIFNIFDEVKSCISISCYLVYVGAQDMLLERSIPKYLALVTVSSTWPCNSLDFTERGRLSILLSDHLYSLKKIPDLFPEDEDEFILGCNRLSGTCHLHHLTL